MPVELVLALLQEINFKRSKNGQLPERAQNFTKPSTFFCQIPSWNTWWKIREISVNAAIFISLLSNERDKPASDYDTVTAEEKKDSLFSEPLTRLLDCKFIWHLYSRGANGRICCQKKFSNHESCFNQYLYERITEITISKSLPNMLELVRVGGNTAPNFYVIHGTSGKKLYSTN